MKNVHFFLAYIIAFILFENWLFHGSSELIVKNAVLSIMMAAFIASYKFVIQYVLSNLMEAYEVATSDDAKFSKALNASVYLAEICILLICMFQLWITGSATALLMLGILPLLAYVTVRNYLKFENENKKTRFLISYGIMSGFIIVPFMFIAVNRLFGITAIKELFDSLPF